MHGYLIKHRSKDYNAAIEPGTSPWYINLKIVDNFKWNVHINGLVQDCSNSIANALELLQSCTKLSISQKDYRRLFMILP